MILVKCKCTLSHVVIKNLSISSVDLTGAIANLELLKSSQVQQR